MKNLFYFFALFLVFTACENPKPEFSGSFYGIVPCADCPGIYYEIHFEENKSYSEKWFYLESDVDTLTSKGEYEIHNDSILVLKNASSQGFFERFKIGEEEILVLDKKGNEIEGNLADFFVLKTTPPEISKNENLFKATGTEPFWSVEIKPGDEMIFKPMDGKQIVFSTPQPQTIQNGIRFSASREGEMLAVEIVDEICQNAMSGEFFSHSVSVTFKTPEMETPQLWSGCGEYVNFENTKKIAHQIDGRWILKQIDGETLPEDTEYKTPSMEINMEENEISGNAGCNGYRGKIKYLGENILGGSQVVSTKMACPGLEVESKFLRIFSGSPIEYVQKENLLIFSNDKTKLIFERASTE